MNTKIDKGVQFNYWKLTYRRKFIRTLWVALLGFLLFLLPSDFTLLGHGRNLFVAIWLAMSVIQAVYNYYRWKQAV